MTQEGEQRDEGVFLVRLDGLVMSPETQIKRRPIRETSAVRREHAGRCESRPSP